MIEDDLTPDPLPALVREVGLSEMRARACQREADSAIVGRDKFLARALEMKANAVATSDPVEWAQYLAEEQRHRDCAALEDQRARKSRREAEASREKADAARTEIAAIRDGASPPEFTADEVRAVLKRLISVGGRSTVAELLYHHGAKSVSDLDPLQYGNVIMSGIEKLQA